jgi:hypothetical protein
MTKRKKNPADPAKKVRAHAPLADEFATRYPHLSKFVRTDGVVEIGYWPGHGESFVRLLLEENLLWESEDRFTTMDELFEALEDAVQQEFEA